MKKKSQKYSSYITQPLVNESDQYIMVINNHHKLIIILKKRDFGQPINKITAEYLFKIEAPSVKQSQDDEEMKNDTLPKTTHILDSQSDDAFETIE
jgi:hypothetical protein